MATQSKSTKDFKKDTIYIDVDDEITMIIEKLQNSPQRIVALVLPKRASVLQSVVNMKLLKRTADNAKKHVVLITSEAGLLPLAGAVGLHVANSLQSKPAVPVAPDGVQASDDSVDNIDEDSAQVVDDFDAGSAANQPIGQLAGGPAGPGDYSEPETIQMDDDDESGVGGAASSALGAAAGAVGGKGQNSKGQSNKGKNKKLKIPNFNKFRLILILGVTLLVVLIGGFFYANTALSKATITLKTNSSDVATKANLTLDPGAAELDLETGTVPAKIASKQLLGTQQVSTSGQKNNGTKASGTVTMTAKVCGSIGQAADVPAGTGVSSAGKTFITQSSTSFSPSGTVSGTCITYPAAGTTSVVAQSAGADYNIGATNFTVAGRSDVTASSGGAFTGGTDNIVKIVTQSDIDSAKQRISSQDKDNTTVKDDLAKNLSAAGYTAIGTSLHAGSPVVTPSAGVGDQADTVTVSQATTYTMYGAKAADIKTIITANVKKQIDTTKQQILKDGFDAAKYEIDTVNASGRLDVVLTTTSLAGPDIKTDKLAAQLAGKKTGDVQATVKAIPGVSDATVKYSPFWVTSVPNKPSKVTFVIEKSAQTPGASNGTNGTKP